MAGTISILVGSLILGLAFSGKRFQDKGPDFYAIWATGFSAVGFLCLSLVTGQERSPFLWVLPVLPAYAFYFLPHALALCWTSVAIGTVALVHFSKDYISFPLESLPGSDERGAYQVIMILLISLISYVVKALARGHVKAVKKAREEAEIAAQAKSRFIDHVSHEMRHTLSAITGTFELVKAESIPLAQRELFIEARRSTQLLTSMIDSTLLMTSIQDKRFAPKPEAFYLKKLAHSVQDSFQERFLAKEVELNFALNADFRLEGDRTSLEYLLTAFFDNALKATQAGGRVDTKIEFKEELLSVSIQDNGCGISESRLTRLHEPFSRTESLDARANRGFGLGLATSSALLDALKGNWGVESQIGQGSRFWFTLPCRDLGVTIEKAWESPKSKENVKVLMVDDDPTCRKVTGKLIERLGYEVQTCNDGQEAINKIALQNFDIVFMDCNMPVLDGFHATQTLRASGFSNPIVALTANTTENDKRKCSNSGMNQILGKPATTSKLKRVLAEYL